jgi:3-hydroxyacyl-CoA dehydrogenase
MRFSRRRKKASRTVSNKSRKNAQSTIRKYFRVSPGMQSLFGLQAQAALVQETLARIHMSTDVKKGVSAADLVIEAIVENVDAKRALFAVVEANVPG